MPIYVPKRRTITLTLPSDPEAHVWGPGELDFWSETRIRSRSERNEINPVSGQAITIADNAVFAYELLHTVLEHPDAGWNLFDETGKPYERNVPTIDTLFVGDLRPDRDHIILEFTKIHFPEYVRQAKAADDTDEGDESAEGNGDQPTPSGGAVSASSDSNEPSDSSPSQTTGPTMSIENLGSTLSPTEVRYPPEPSSETQG